MCQLRWYRKLLVRHRRIGSIPVCCVFLMCQKLLCVLYTVSIILKVWMTKGLPWQVLFFVCISGLYIGSSFVLELCVAVL